MIEIAIKILNFTLRYVKTSDRYYDDKKSIFE